MIAPVQEKARLPPKRVDAFSPSGSHALEFAEIDTDNSLVSQARSDQRKGVALQELPEWLVGILKELPTLAVCLIVVWFAYTRLERQHDKHLKSKDDEIERLVKEKNELQKQFMKKRRSTSDK